LADKILVVEDNDILRKLLVTALCKNYEIVEACSGEQALSIAAQGDVRLVLLDIMMPGMDGLETCLRLRRNPRSCHSIIVMLTARDTEEDVVTGLKMGADDYLIKPVNFSELKARIDSHLRRQWRDLQASPLTGLPGNRQIQQILSTNLKAGVSFAVIYADLNSFKAYNDRYGFTAGDEILNYTANVLTNIVVEAGDTETDFVGHIGGDDFIIVTTPERCETICKLAIERFDAEIEDFYDSKDLEKGGIETVDRQGNKIIAPVLSISLSVVIHEKDRFSHPGQISQIAAEIKKQVKKDIKSSYLIDRRKPNSKESKDE
jgi:diguanylate cyclase (GGDEF)-like protein